MAQSATPFDTLAALRDLEAAGIDRPQAEAIASQLATAVTAGHTELATKADLARLETKLLTVAVGIVIAQTALVFGLHKLTI